MEKHNKITPAINSHFANDFELMLDFLSYTRDDFLEEHPEIQEYQYNNTIVKILERLNMLCYISKPISQIHGIDMHEICRKRNVHTDYLLTFCS